MRLVNIAAYQFVALSETQLIDLQKKLKEKAQVEALKGTILLSHEGINLMMAGEPDGIENYKAFLATLFSNLTYKESLSEKEPFSKLLVRIKKTIIHMGTDEVDAVNEKTAYVTPKMLKAWYEEKKDMIVLDVRNDYEKNFGTFAEAIDLNIPTFRDFPEAVEKLPEDFKNKPIVTFCTGGIRCEKAAVLLQKKGFKEVYQLEGGILNYFSQCGGDYFEGDCFVFDNRIAIDAQLKEVLNPNSDHTHRYETE